MLLPSLLLNEKIQRDECEDDFYIDRIGPTDLLRLNIWPNCY